MTAPKLENWKFWIVKPKAGTNQIKNPQFSGPEYVTGWAAYGAGVTIASHPDDARRGAYSMKVNPATNVESSAYYAGLTVVSGSAYTFSVDVKGVAGQVMWISIANVSGTAKGYKEFTATGYWQRVEVSHTAAENKTDYRVYVARNSTASTAAFYIDGAQFEQASKATTFIEGYLAGCRWTGAARNSPSERSAFNGLGGELIDISTYAKIISVQGLGNGDWNQILTKMTSGGDMYQTHIRKSRNFSMVLAYHGNNQGDLQANRKVIIDALRPDLLFGGLDERRIIRYQGFAANGDEATQPVDIVCVFQPSLNDTPSMPVFQKDILSFTIPSGLLQGAYNEGKELDLYADFPAEFIVKRDKDGNWCTWDTDHYDSLITGLNGTVYCMAEGPDGKIYVGGAFSGYFNGVGLGGLARWNPISKAYEYCGVDGLTGLVATMAFDANGDLYIGGKFSNLMNVAEADNIAKITGLNGTPSVENLGTGVNDEVLGIVIAPNGDAYVGGGFTSAGGVANTTRIAKWNGTTWSALSTGLNYSVECLAMSPSGVLYVGGNFTDAAYPRLCKWNGTAFSVVGENTDINAPVRSLTFGATGFLYVGGAFTNAGGQPNADYIARWTGSTWESLGTGTNGAVHNITVNSGKVYTVGAFTTAGGLTLNDRVAVFTNGAWQPLDVNLPGTADVRSILPASDGSLYIGGAFSTTAASENAITGVVALNLNVASASANTYPFIQVHGPGTLKAITNYSTGKTIAFDGLTLLAGEWINLFFDPLNLRFYSGWSGRGNLMRYIVPGSDYGDFYLKPGNNLISLFYPDSDPDLGSGAFISWNPQFWGLDGALL